jgi:hypothetical protein
MAEISIEIRGLRELYRKLGTDVLTVIEPAFAAGVIRIERRMKDYPAPRSGQTYQRTGTLGRRWTHRVTRTPDTIRGEVGNNTRYAPWVQAQEFQAGPHRGRWTTDQQALEEEALRIEAEAGQLVIRALAGS